MSNSALINNTILSPNYSTRIFPITKITIHHAAAVGVSSRRIAEGFLPRERKASSNYTIGVDGDITLVVPEEYCAWTSGTWDEYGHGNDGMAVTIEVANDAGEPDWHVSDLTLQSLIRLCVDICQRNNIKALNFTGDATGNLTQHNYFQATRCPGEYLKTKFQYIADEVNRRLADEIEPKEIYRVRASWDDALTQLGAFSNLDNAITKAKEYGYNVYNSKGEMVYQTPEEPAPIPEPEVIIPSPEPTPAPEEDLIPNPELETEITPEPELELKEEIIDNASEDVVEPTPKKEPIITKIIKAILNALMSIFKKK